MININQPQNTAPEPDEPEEQRSQYRQNDRRGMCFRLRLLYVYYACYVYKWKEGIVRLFK